MSAGASAFSALADLWNYFFGSENTMTTTVVKTGRTQIQSNGSKIQMIKIPRKTINRVFSPIGSNKATFNITIDSINIPRKDSIKATSMLRERFRNQRDSLRKAYSYWFNQ